MPSLSQLLLGVNKQKGSNSPSSFSSRQGFSPFSRIKVSSATSSGGRQHLRTKSENGAAGAGCSNGSFHSGTRFSDLSKRASPTSHSGHGYSEPYDTRYERYRQIYLATSPERELSTLNAAIVNVRKWLKKKHVILQTLRHTVAAPDSHPHPHPDPDRGQISPGNLGEKSPSPSLLHDSDAENNPQALLEKLVRESGDQQEAVDVLLDRGGRYLQQRACVTLETDLENLAFLWSSYTSQLFTLHDSTKEAPSSPDHILPPTHTPTPLSVGKENLVHHSTPVKWRKGGKAPHKLLSFDSPANNGNSSNGSYYYDSFSLEESSISHVTSSPSKSLSSSFASCLDDERKKSSVSDSVKKNLSSSFASSDDEQSITHQSCVVSDSKKNLSSSFADFDKQENTPTTKSQAQQPDSNFDTTTHKEESSSTSTTDQPTADTVAQTPSRRESFEEGEEKILQELHSPESSAAKSKETNGVEREKGRRILPPAPPVPLRPREDLGGQTLHQQAARLGSNAGVEDELENPHSPETSKKQQQQKEERKQKRSSPPSPPSSRNRVISISLWPAPQNTESSWLKVPGEGIFTASRRSSRLLSLPDQPSNTDHTEGHTHSKRRASCGQQHNTASDQGATTGGDPRSTVTESGQDPERGAAAAEVGGSFLGKRGKEIHNEQQQRQQREQQDLTAPPATEGKPAPDQPGDDDDVDVQHLSPSTGLLQLQLGLTASEENLKMEIEDALREIQGAEDALQDAPLDITGDSSMNTPRTSSDSESQDDGTADLPTGPKRRRMSPLPSNGSPLLSVSGSPLLGVGCCGSPLVSGESSLSVTPTSSPAGTLPRDFRQRYKKDELWKAIESNYQYLMDKEIIETCQTEAAGLGEEGQEGATEGGSFTEFLKQYQELVDWLNQTQRHTQRTLTSLSEKYLNQAYHEELLERCPRRELLTRYSQQLLVRFPHLAEQLACRMQRLNAQWALVEAAITPQPGDATATSMRQDLECDLATLRRWLNSTESRLLPLTIRADWTDAELEDRLKHHQVLQQDIESHSRIVSAVLKLSERLEREASSSSSPSSSWSSAGDCQSLQLVALTLERRWHGIWLQSLEWQCRLEEAINRRKGLYGSGFNFSGFTLPTLDESGGGGDSDDNAGGGGRRGGGGGRGHSDLDLKLNGHVSSGSNGSLFELSDDSLLFIGGARTEHLASGGESSGSPTSPGWLSPQSPPLASPRLTNFLDRSSGDSANISECESARMGDPPLGGSSPEASAGMGGQDGGEGVPSPALEMGKVPQEAKDIGYSSESQSNDETETMHQQLALECRFGSRLIEVSSDSPLGGKMSLPAPGSVRNDYYCMTHVDLDSTDKTNTTTDDGGNSTDDRDNKAEEVEKRKQQNGVVTVGGVCMTGLVTGSGDSCRFSPRGSREDIAVKSYLESSDEVEGVCGIVDPNPQPCSQSESDSGGGADSQDKIRYLIAHAEDLVKNPRPSGTPSQGSPQRKRASPSKQTQTVVMMETSSNVESSCDASSENSEESGNEQFSTATDDADDTLFDSVITLDSTTSAVESASVHMSKSVSPSPGYQTLEPARLRKTAGRGGKKDRPWSVAGLHSLKSSMTTEEFQPLSTSESAIDRMRANTDTDSASCLFVSQAHASTLPQRGGYQRAVSACERSSPSPRAGEKRKLKYSSSSSATDSRSSATQVAPSTEDDEDNKTFVYDSAEQMRSSQCLSSSCVLESESDTTDEYVTASMDEMMTSADEDPHNSTGSFSENAWDNYQMLYPTASEDATEEMLHWEPVDDMEFDDDFNLTFPPNSSSLLSHAIRSTANKMKLRPVRSGDDSDSDMEDFRSVLEDSETCLKVVNHSLRKKRNNPMGTGLATPAKYVEMLATCETNIDCVKNVCQHLTQEDIGVGDVQRVQELLIQWERLQALAGERLQQAQLLGVVGEGVAAFKALLTSLAQCCRDDGASGNFFSSREELMAAIQQLKGKQGELERQVGKLGEHRKVVDKLSELPCVNVSKHQHELQGLTHAATDAHHRLGQRIQSLEKMSLVWVQYLDGQQELDTLMGADRTRLATLLAQREAGHTVTRQKVLHELETLESRLSVYQSKLEVLQALRQRLTGVWNDQTQRSFLASMADLKNQLHVVTLRCRQMQRDVEDEREGDEGLEAALRLGRLAMSPPTTIAESADRTMQARSSGSLYSKPMRMEEGHSYLGVGGDSDSAWQWLRWLPLQVVALVMVAGLVYALDPDLLSQLTSLTFTPEVRYENGPSGV